ncbi:MAG: adenosylhomocysteinase [Planctomycetota bacterium]
MEHDIKDFKLAEAGKKRIEWADRFMPVLGMIRKRFEKQKPLAGVKMACCMHVTSETANLMRTLKAGGALPALCASNPLSTQDDVAASLVKNDGVSVFAIRGENNKVYYSHIDSTLKRKPNITMDDGADLVSAIHSKMTNLIPAIYGSMEETTTGIIRLRAMERDKALKIPVFAVNDADAKHLFDNRYGTGQSTVDGILRSTNILFAGLNVVVGGYGWCGRGFATRARGMGAKIIVTEVDPLRALEATMDGFAVMPMKKAAEIGDVFCTVTGDKNVIAKEHFVKMKDGAIVCNSGHFNVEIDLDALKTMSKKVVKDVRPNVEAYLLKNGKTIYVLAQGRLVNLSAAEGHPAVVMDMSFAIQALTAEYTVKKKGKLEPIVYSVPKEIDKEVAKLKLATMGIEIDKLTKEQKKYLADWREGT